MKDMLGRMAPVEAGQALSLILASIPGGLPKTENCGLLEATGRVLSGPVSSAEDIPGFDRSTMDGYAVMASDTFGAGETAPSYIEVIGEVLMGQEADMEITPGKTVRIATGGMLPRGADAVLMLEYATEVDSRMIEAQKSLAPGENVIRKGDDLARGEEIIAEGTLIRPQDAAALASAGVDTVSVYKKPRVSILSTGDEVVPPNEPLRPGLIRDSNSYHLAGLVAEENAEPLVKGIVPDDFDALLSMVRQATEDSEMILISGGSSVGARDMSSRVIEELGSILFHGVQMKPGKPFLAGTAGQRPVFALPGHPRAVAVCFDTFVRPALRKLSGRKGFGFRGLKTTLEARLAKSVHSGSGRLEHIDVILEERDGLLWAEPVLGKSGLLRTMVRSDGSFTVPREITGYEKGSQVTVTLY